MIPYSSVQGICFYYLLKSIKSQEKKWIYFFLLKLWRIPTFSMDLFWNKIKIYALTHFLLYNYSTALTLLIKNEFSYLKNVRLSKRLEQTAGMFVFN